MITQIRTSEQLSIDQDLSLNNRKIVNLADPSDDLDAVNKRYVNMYIQGLQFKKSVRVATNTNINLGAAPETIDGVDLIIGDRILVKDQEQKHQNGIYIFSQRDEQMLRASDFDDWSEMVSSFVFVEEGNTYKDTGWVCIADRDGTLGASPIDWLQFSGAGSIIGGSGISINGNIISTRLHDVGGLAFNNGEIAIKLDGGTLQLGVNGLKVTDGMYQPMNSRLTSIANMVGNGLMVKIGESILSRTLIAGSGISIMNENGANNPIISINPSQALLLTNYVCNETPAGDINGLNKVFTSARNYILNTVQVYLNGLLQRSGTDYTLANNNQIVFSNAPQEGDKIIISYIAMA